MTTAWVQVMGSEGSNRPPPTPFIIPFWQTVRTPSANQLSAETSEKVPGA